MSLVGTRPPTVDEYEQYEIGHRKRLLGQILGAVFVFCRDTFFWGTPWSYGTGIAAGVVIVRLLSSVVIGIVLVKVITAALVKTGVLKGFVCAK